MIWKYIEHTLKYSEMIKIWTKAATFSCISFTTFAVCRNSSRAAAVEPSVGPNKEPLQKFSEFGNDPGFFLWFILDLMILIFNVNSHLYNPMNPTIRPSHTHHATTLPTSTNPPSQRPCERGPCRCSVPHPLGEQCQKPSPWHSGPATADMVSTEEMDGIGCSKSCQRHQIPMYFDHNSMI